jgi:hypothetical protein
MDSWPIECTADRRRFRVIAFALQDYPQLLDVVFDRDSPKTLLPPEELLKSFNGLSRGEGILLRSALDLWSSEGSVMILEIVKHLVSGHFRNVMDAFCLLRLSDRSVDLFLNQTEEGSHGQPIIP